MKPHRMTLRESLRWTMIGLLCAPLGLAVNAEVAGYIGCHRVVEQVSLLSPQWDPATFTCRAVL